MTTPVLDGHVHLIDPERLSYPWLPAGDALRQRWEAAGYVAAAPEVTGVIVVEAGAATAQAREEVAFVRAQAAAWPGIRGIVTQAPADDTAALGRVLAELVADGLVAGVRRNLQDEPPGFFRDPGLAAGLRRLGEAGLPFDACVRSWQLTELNQLAAACPGTVIVLDHAGKPRCGDDLTSWRTAMRALAARPNVRCKLSGLATEAAPGARPDDVLAAVGVALSEFGAGRCMYGSDWPVCNLATSPRSWLALISAALDAAGTSEGERNRVLADTALATYRVQGAAMRQAELPSAGRASS